MEMRTLHFVLTRDTCSICCVLSHEPLSKLWSTKKRPHQTTVWYALYTHSATYKHRYYVTHSLTVCLSMSLSLSSSTADNNNNKFLFYSRSITLHWQNHGRRSFPSHQRRDDAKRHAIHWTTRQLGRKSGCTKQITNGRRYRGGYRLRTAVWRRPHGQSRFVCGNHGSGGERYDHIGTLKLKGGHRHHRYCTHNAYDDMCMDVYINLMKLQYMLSSSLEIFTEPTQTLTCFCFYTASRVRMIACSDRPLLMIGLCHSRNVFRHGLGSLQSADCNDAATKIFPIFRRRRHDWTRKRCCHQLTVKWRNTVESKRMQRQHVFWENDASPESVSRQSTQPYCGSSYYSWKHQNAVT